MDAVLFSVLKRDASIVIGRSEEADICVHNITVSRRHARVVCDARGEVSITDLGSRNGTYVNERPVLSEMLHPGQRVCVGAVALRLDLLDEGEVQHLEGLRRRLEMRIDKDPLTGLATAAFVENPLPSYLDFHMGEGRPVCVVALDVDEFRSVNATYPSAVGDEILRVISRKIEFTSRSTDVGVRHAGDAFYVFLFNASAEGGVTFAERLRYRIESHPWESVHPDLRITCSFGVAEMRPSEGISEWLKRVDEAMDRARKTGRNRVEKAVAF